MEPLEFLVDNRIAKGVDEELSIENWYLREARVTAQRLGT